MKNIIKILFISFFSLLLVSCSTKTKHKIGLLNPGPNEYEVTKNKPLEMPPHYNLKESKNSDVTSTNENLSKAEKELLKEASKN